jgi:hypothetical protein
MTERRLTVTLTAKRRLKVLWRDGWECKMPVCLHPSPADPDRVDRTINPRARAGTPWAATVDHVIPVAAGGTDKQENLRAAHALCNMLAAGEQIDGVVRAARRLEREARAGPDPYDRIRQEERDAHDAGLTYTIGSIFGEQRKDANENTRTVSSGPDRGAPPAAQVDGSGCACRAGCADIGDRHGADGAVEHRET